MDIFGDSGELYTIRNEFFTNQHQKVIAYPLDLFSPEARLKALEYQIRLSVAISQDALQLIDKGKLLFPDNDSLFHLLQAWNDLKSFGTVELTYFDDVEAAQFELQAVLTALYLAKLHKDIDLAIALLVSYTNRKSNMYELEPYLVLVQLYLVKGQFGDAYKVYLAFQKFPESARDNIIYHVLESWISIAKGETYNINNAKYFYEELLTLDFEGDARAKFHILNMLLVTTLQLKHFPEAEQILSQIQALGFAGAANDDFLANQVTFEYLTKTNPDVAPLLKQLQETNPEHQLVVDWKEKNQKFDDIVAKYAAQG